MTELLLDPEIGKKIPTRQAYEMYQRGKTDLNFPPNRISAIGRGEFEPVGSGSGDDWSNRQKLIQSSWYDENKMKLNRRIEVVLRSSPIEVAKDTIQQP